MPESHTAVTGDIPEPLLQLVAAHSDPPAPETLAPLRDRLLGRYAGQVDAILVYGSCLRGGDYYDGLVDLWVVVGRYRKAHRSGWHSLLNRLLPPNVYYLEAPVAGRTLRAKYAVISGRDLWRGTSGKWFHSYLWGRFSQPVGLLFARDSHARNRVHRCMARAMITFCERVAPQLPASFDSKQFWENGLSLSYGAELRAEPPERSHTLYQSAADYYTAAARTILPWLPYGIHEHPPDSGRFTSRIPPAVRRRNGLAWSLRRWQGKLLSVLRLLKGLLTFRGGVDYIVWKLERHSGERIEVSERVRRYPAIFIWGLFWRLYRRGIFR